ncbi:unnamed protein product [Xylocopa violacea]|uniref:Uncharacterized protein n=1 Tax=Xylocopa violacea TaxID=135666 RepID=A0ABP1N2K7_XYLVO
MLFTEQHRSSSQAAIEEQRVKRSNGRKREFSKHCSQTVAVNHTRQRENNPGCFQNRPSKFGRGTVERSLRERDSNLVSIIKAPNLQGARSRVIAIRCQRGTSEKM